MGITKTLWKVVRRPMTRWWLRNGSWWLLGIVVVNVAYSYINSGGVGSSNQFPHVTESIVNVLRYYIPLVILVVSSSICDGFVDKFYEQHATSFPKEVLWGRYLLALFQLMPIAGVGILAGMATEAFFLASGFYSQINMIHHNLVILSPISESVNLAVSGVWLVLFVVLAERRPFLKYGVFLAFLVSPLLDIFLFEAVYMRLNFPFIYTEPNVQHLFLLVLPLWLIYAYALKVGRFKLATVLQAVIMISIMGNTIIIKLYQGLGVGYLNGLAFASELIVSPFYNKSQLWSSVSTWLLLSYDSPETLLSFLPFLLVPILDCIGPCFLLGLIYLFVFSPYPKGWVDYCWEKLSSPR